MINKTYLLIFALLASTSIQAQQASPLHLQLGAKIHSGSWSGENVGQNDGDFESDATTGIGLSIGLAKGAWFGSFTMQSGEYTFKENQTFPIDDGGVIPAPSESSIGSGFFTLSGGYKINQYISVQAGFKSFVQSWERPKREIGYSGLGMGISGYWPINNDWTSYGSLGFNAYGIEDANGSELGEAGASSFELGAAYRLNTVSSLSFGLRTENISSEFDNGNEQKHSVNNIFLGYNRVFTF